jgi:hypothetical protein
MSLPTVTANPLLLVLLAMALIVPTGTATTRTVRGYVLDSACAFTKGIGKPISKECAVSCANSGSPLVVQAEDGVIYLPISDLTPAKGQNAKLIPFAGKKVAATGAVFDRGSSHAIVVRNIELVPDGK